MSALGAPAREATKMVAGFMHFLADCLEETAGADKSPAAGTTTIHIETATLHVASPAETLAALNAERDRGTAAGEHAGETFRHVEHAGHVHVAARVDQAERRRAAARDKLERTRRRPWWHAFVPDRGPGDQKDYTLAGRK